MMTSPYFPSQEFAEQVDAAFQFGGRHDFAAYQFGFGVHADDDVFAHGYGYACEGWPVARPSQLMRATSVLPNAPVRIGSLRGMPPIWVSMFTLGKMAFRCFL
jgi:hypothetical protein